MHTFLWAARKEAHADKLIAHAEAHIPGLSGHVRVARVVAPDDWRARTQLDHHTLAGIAPLLGAWRVPRKTPVAGLCFVGAQLESGGGVNNVMPPTFKTARQIHAKAASG